MNLDILFQKVIDFSLSNSIMKPSLLKSLRELLWVKDILI